MEEKENLIVFPHEISGRFNWTSINVYAIYFVHGEDKYPED